jgi:diguanylate cyclase (GGDEF)-like protein
MRTKLAMAAAAAQVVQVPPIYLVPPVFLLLLAFQVLLGTAMPGSVLAFRLAHAWFDIFIIGIVAATVVTAYGLYARWTKAPAPNDPSIEETNAIGQLRKIGRNALTSLAGRGMFDSMATTRLAAGEQFSVLLLGLDGFRRVNDQYGMPCGDNLLQQVGDRLRRAAPDANSVAHLFSDQFAIMAAGMPTAGEAEALALRLLRAFDAPFEREGGTLRIFASIGMAEAPRHGSDMFILMQAAARALQAAKLAGGGVWRIYGHHMYDTISALRYALPVAIAERQIVPYYQPIVDLNCGRIAGIEVLARWNHPTRGLLLPHLFIDLADEAGRLSDITLSLLRQVGQDSANWPESLFFAFNIAANQLHDVLAYASMQPDGDRYILAPHRLEVELTETALVKDIEATCEVVRVLRDRGTRVILDDFGSGHGNFHHLRGIPFDGLKIDKEFVLDMLIHPAAEICVRSIAEVGHQLGTEVTAEGVSTAEIATRVAALGCRYGQGSFYSMPVPQEGVQAMLDRIGVSPARPGLVIPRTGRPPLAQVSPAGAQGTRRDRRSDDAKPGQFPVPVSPSHLGG